MTRARVRRALLDPFEAEVERVPTLKKRWDNGELVETHARTHGDSSDKR